MMVRRLASLLCLGAALAAPVVAHAQPTANDDAAVGDRAVQLADEGRRLFEAGKWDQAFERFQAADVLFPSPLFKLYMARARMNQSRYLEARTIYRDIDAMKLGPEAPPSFVTAQTDGRQELAELATKIPSLIVSVKGAKSPDVVVKIDGIEVKPDQATELDPGDHYVIVSADGVEKSAQRTLKPSQRDVRVEIDLQTQGPAIGPTKPEEPKGGVDIGPIGWAILGVGGAGLIAGGIIGGLALSKDADFVASCPDLVCPDDVSLRDEQETITTLADAATGLLIAGGVLAAAGLTIGIVGVTSSKNDEPAARVEVRAGLGFFSIVGSY